MQMVRHGDDYDSARWHARYDFPKQIGLRPIGIATIGKPTKRLARKCFGQVRGFEQGLQIPAAQRADADFTDPALPLHMVERRQKLIVCDHAPAHNENLRLHSYGIPVFLLVASANTSSSTATLSRMAGRVITNGGAILTVPPPKPTELNMSTPLSTHRSITCHARSPSGSLVPGATHAIPATRPLPSTCPICGNRVCSTPSRSCSTAPICRAFSASFSETTSSMDASAAAQQTGFPVWVEVILPAGCRSITSGRPATAEIGSELD